jgi:hypothetical protein
LRLGGSERSEVSPWKRTADAIMVSQFTPPSCLFYGSLSQ